MSILRNANRRTTMIDLSPYREQMIEAILESHTDEAHIKHLYADRAEVRREVETYRPYAEKDVDAIIAALAAVKRS